MNGTTLRRPTRLAATTRFVVILVAILTLAASLVSIDALSRRIQLVSHTNVKLGTEPDKVALSWHTQSRVSGSPPVTSPAPLPPARRCSHALQYFGVNLNGAEFGTARPGVYGTDYIYPTHAEIDYFASKGMNILRLPFWIER